MKKLTTKEISNIVKANKSVDKWGIFSTFNDKLKNNKRKLKFMRNGWRLSETMKNKIVSELQVSFENTNVESVSFEVGVRPGYGEYDFLKIIKDEN